MPDTESTAPDTEPAGVEAVVSLLDEEHDARVRGIWKALEERFGLQGIYSTPYPHFSYHSAESYGADKAQAVLKRAAASVKPFQVQTAGLGLFPGERPVLFLPVVRDHRLSHVHASLYPDLAQLAVHENRYYRPEAWIPHITLAYGDLTPEGLPEVVRFLGGEGLEWSIEIANFALVCTNEQDQRLSFRTELREKA